MSQHLHEKILNAVREYQSAEIKLVELLAEADQSKLYLSYGHASLFQYCLKELGLTEERTCALTAVCRKAEKLPEFKAALLDGSLTVSKAARITGTLKEDDAASNQEWIQKAQTLTKRELEKEVAAANPKAAVQSKVKYVQNERLNFSTGITEAIHSKLRRAQDLESQKKGKHADLEAVLEAALDSYLKQNDPVLKAKNKKPRAAKKSEKVYLARAVARSPIPQATKDKLLIASNGRCMHISPTPKGPIRCEEKRWIDIHHKIPVKDGGSNDLDNLIVICRAHHRAVHTLDPRMEH